MNNNVLYLEADEEITAAIDKLVKMPSADVKIVVPKRSTLLQSVVNLKLLKRAADDAGKKLVLVTGDRTSTHLAGRLGLAVAATLTSQPATPDAGQPEPEASDTVEAEEEDATAETEEVAPVPAPAPHGNTKPSYAKPMMVRKSVSQPSEPTANVTPPTPSALGKGDKKKHVPDFNSLQKKLLWVGLAGIVIIGLFVANYFLIHANVTLYAQGSKIDTSFTVTVDPAIKTSDASQANLVGANLQSAHDLTETVQATGKKDVGTKATGQVTVTNYCYNPGTLPAGTIFSSQSGMKFTSTQDVAVPTAVPFLGNCASTSVAVPVVATQNGDSYNLANGTLYSVGSAPSDKLKGTGNQMSGGTSKTVGVVTQDDLDKAKADLVTKDKDSSQKDLENKVASGNRTIPESFTQTVGDATANPAVGAQADQTVITVHVAYNELSVPSKDLETLLQAQELKQAGSQNQIYDDGLSNLKVAVIKNNPGAASTFTFSASAYGGAKLDPTAIAKQLVGRRYGDAADTASRLPGVARADISLTPFWATSLPHIPGHIKVTIKVAKQ